MPCSISTTFCCLVRPTLRSATRPFRAAFNYVIVWVSPSLLVSWRAPPHDCRSSGSSLTPIGTLSLPADKLARLRSVIVEWREHKFCRKRQLLSLIGQLQHACREVQAGRTFLRRMIDLSRPLSESWITGYDLRWWDLYTIRKYGSTFYIWIAMVKIVQIKILTSKSRTC